MGYIFDALSRNGGKDDADAATPAARSLPELDAIAGSQQLATPPLDAQLDELSARVEQLTAEFRGDEAVDMMPVVASDDADPVAPPVLTLAAEPVPTHADLDTVAMAARPTPVGAPATQRDERLVVLRDPSSLMAEEYRSIRTQLLARCEHKRNLVHTITSATPQEGKTITSMNLGLSFAELRNRSIIVIEADLRLPTFANLIDLPEGPGMIQYLRQEAELDQVVRSVDGSRLHVIPAGGRCSSQAIQLLSSARMVQLLSDLKQRYDHVIIDTPPVTELADAGILGALSNEVMLVVRMNRTPQTLVDGAIRTLRGYKAPVAGVIATDQQRSRRKYYYYHYGYRYRYGAKDAA